MVMFLKTKIVINLNLWLLVAPLTNMKECRKNSQLLHSYKVFFNHSYNIYQKKTKKQKTGKKNKQREKQKIKKESTSIYVKMTKVIKK